MKNYRMTKTDTEYFVNEELLKENPFTFYRNPEKEDDLSLQSDYVFEDDNIKLIIENYVKTKNIHRRDWIVFYQNGEIDFYCDYERKCKYEYNKGKFEYICNKEFEDEPNKEYTYTVKIEKKKIHWLFKEVLINKISEILVKNNWEYYWSLKYQLEKTPYYTKNKT